MYEGFDRSYIDCLEYLTKPRPDYGAMAQSISDKNALERERAEQERALRHWDGRPPA
jgi:hypothetical protein